MDTDSRRDFLKKAALLSGAAGIAATFPPSILRALAIDPAAGSTFLDAEHVVILMQENRSFDHCLGSLQGVRGFNDPRAIRLPDKNRVWLQTDQAGRTYAPFRLGLKETKATWMGSLPHTWSDQTDARNGGRFDRWLEVKQSTHEEYAQIPLTLGYYTREDLPFYYALADAFTVCDQNFCSSLTGTTPNRLYLWTGTIRGEQSAAAPARVMNEDLDYGAEARWTTFPERLEDHGISWKIYQNELGVDVGLAGEEGPWLANFGDNPIEWFTQFNVRFLPAYIAFLPVKIKRLTGEIQELSSRLATLAEGSAAAVELKKELALRQDRLKAAEVEQKTWTPENYARLSAREKNLHEKAFTTNSADPHYHELSRESYPDGAIVREMIVPKGDILHRFRADVKEGKLPAVSWLVAPENFSDHPSAPWYGAWYVSEAMDILTQNPEVWKKTIFILCYDENDGYFDHVPPFVPPDPDRPGSGLASAGLDPALDHVKREQELPRRGAAQARGGPIGLGYRVPLLIASPWSRGGAVNSQVFDHTSVLQFLETFLSQKTGQKVTQPQISPWRRAVCGDLTSVFKPYHGEKIPLPQSVDREAFMADVHRAQFKQAPAGYKALTREEIEQINRDPAASPLMPRQEPGVRPACALPYQLYAEARLSPDGKHIALELEAGNAIFRERSAGAPFHVYSHTESYPRAYAVKAGDRLADTWNLEALPQGDYHLEVYGPNGFFRHFTGDRTDPAVTITCDYEQKGRALTGNLVVKVTNSGKDGLSVLVTDNAYKRAPSSLELAPGSAGTIPLNLTSSFGWYDVSVSVEGAGRFQRRYAGRVESGQSGFTDPAMGGVA